MLPTTESEIDAFLGAFESCTLPKERWTHSAHIFGGACYVHRLGEAAAIDHMRLSIRRFNESVGGKNTDTSGYHETITVFWIKLLHNFLRTEPTEARATFAALAVARFATDRSLLTRFYDFDVVNSIEARRTWIAPTLTSLEIPLMK
jgi:hypothetical protein